jgi:hypothetical protein
MGGYYYIRLLMISELVYKCQEVEESEEIDTAGKLYQLQQDLERIEILVQDLLISVHRDLKSEI